jgi:hypothetical protein
MRDNRLTLPPMLTALEGQKIVRMKTEGKGANEIAK